MTPSPGAGAPTAVGRHPSSSAETPTDTVSGAKSSSVLTDRRSPFPRLHFVPTPSRRLPKFTRAKPSWRPHLVLQERDLEFLKAIDEHRLLSTPRILTLFP